MRIDQNKMNKPAPGAAVPTPNTITELLDSTNLSRQTIDSLETLLCTVSPGKAYRTLNKIFLTYVQSDFQIMSQEDADVMFFISEFLREIQEE